MYIKESGGIATIYTLGQLRTDNAGTSFPSVIPEATLATYDVYPYVIATKPAYDEATQNIALGDVLDVAGTWTQGWDITAKSAEEQTVYEDAANLEADIILLRADTEVLGLLKARPDQINTYIDTNVTDINSAKEVLKIYGRALAVLAATVIN